MSDLIKKLTVIITIFILSSISVMIPVLGYEPNSKIISSKQSNLFENLLFDRIINFSMKLGRIPSLSACIIKNDEVIWSKGYGFYDIEQKKHTSTNISYMIASISKTITATAIMQLYEQEKFDLDENINNYLPFNVSNPYYSDVNITFRMLLAHTSSLADEPDYYHGIEYSKDPDPMEEWIKDYFYENDELNPAAWREECPGERYHYNSIDYCLIGYIIEQITKKSFNEYCKENIFIPLNMSKTSFLLTEMDLDTLAKPYLLEDGTIFSKYYFPLEHYSWRMYPGGNMMASADDLSHFLIAHMKGGIYNGVRILNESTVDLMQTIQTPNKDYGIHYGLGFHIWRNIFGKKTYVGHLGALYGFDTRMKFRVSDKTGIIYYINRNINREVRGKIAHLIIERALFKLADKI